MLPETAEKYTIHLVEGQSESPDRETTRRRKIGESLERKFLGTEGRIVVL